MTAEIACRIVSWNEIDQWAEDVARKIRASGWAPEIVVGLTRGGWVPARILCDNLVCKNLFSIKVEHWGITAQTDNKAKLVQELALDIKGKNVLLVDDITDTGESMTLSLEHVKAKGPKSVRTAALLHIAHSKIEPDFYSQFVPKDQWKWFIFPWNFREDMENLIGKLSSEITDPHELADLMERKYDLAKSPKIQSAIIQHLEKRGRK